MRVTRRPGAARADEHEYEQDRDARREDSERDPHTRSTAQRPGKFRATSVLDGDERADRRVGPHLRCGVERQLDTAEALRSPERRPVEGVDRVAAVEVAD